MKEIIIDGKVCISQASAGRLIDVNRQWIGQLLDQGRLNTYYQKGNSNRLVSKEEVLNIKDLPKGRPQNYPQFSKGVKVVINNSKLKNVRGTILRPYGERVEVELAENGDNVWAYVSDIRLAK